MIAAIACSGGRLGRLRPRGGRDGRRYKVLGALVAAWAFVAASAAGAAGIRAGEPFPLLAAGPGKGIQGEPTVAYGGGVHLVTWREGWHGKGGSSRVMAARVSAEGKVLDARGIEVAPARLGVQERPRVAFGGGTFLVVWQELKDGRDHDVRAARVSPAGQVLDREPITIAGGPRNQALPDVAGDGAQFLVVWQGLRDQETAYRGWAAVVGADGKVGQPVETGVTPQPKVAWNGLAYLVVGGGIGTFAGEVRGVRLARDGAVIRGKPIVAIGGTKAAAFSIAGVADGHWLVVSHRSQPDPWGWGGPGAIRVGLIDGEGGLGNPQAVKEPAGVQARQPGWLDIGREKRAGATWPWGQSAVAFDGRLAMVVWPRHHLAGEKFTELENGDLVAARVDGFESLDPAGVMVADEAGDERNPALAAGGGGRLLLVYERAEGQGRVSILGRVLTAE